MADGHDQMWRSRPNAPPSGTILSPFNAIEDGAAKEFAWGVGINAFRMFVVRKADQVFGYLNMCPHYSLPLNHRPDQFLTRDGTRIMCRQHLALFDIEHGTCLDGACEGTALWPISVSVERSMIVVS